MFMLSQIQGRKDARRRSGQWLTGIQRGAQPCLTAVIALYASAAAAVAEPRGRIVGWGRDGAVVEHGALHDIVAILQMAPAGRQHGTRNRNHATRTTGPARRRGP